METISEQRHKEIEKQKIEYEGKIEAISEILEKRNDVIKKLEDEHREKINDLETISEQRHKEIEKQNIEYEGKIEVISEILEKRNDVIKNLEDEHREKINDLELISEQRHKEMKKLKDEHTEKISELEDIIEQRNRDIEELKDKLEEGGRISERSQRNSDIIEQRNEEFKKKDIEAEEGVETIQKPCITQCPSKTKIPVPVKFGVVNRNEQKGNKDKVNDAIEKKFQPKDKDIEEITKLMTQLKTKNNEIKKLTAEIIALKEVHEKLIKQNEEVFTKKLKTKNEKINNIVKKNIKELEQVRKENEDKFTELKAKDRETIEKMNELKQIIKEKQEELTTQTKIGKNKIEKLEEDIKECKEALEKVIEERNVAHDILASHNKERKATNDREIQELKDTLENNLELLKNKDIKIEELEQIIKKCKEAMEKVIKERNVAHDLLLNRDKAHKAKNDQELKHTLESNLEQLKKKDIKIKELEQNIKKGKEALVKASAEYNILVSLDKERKATTDREINELMQSLENNLHLINNKDIRIEELEQSIKNCKEAMEQAIKERNVAHDLLASHDNERKATNDREIQELKQSLENNLHLINNKDIRIEELEQSIKKGKEAIEKAIKERNVAHDLLLSRDKVSKDTNDREIQELKHNLENNLEQLQQKDIRIEELEQNIKKAKEALEKASTENNILVSLDKEHKATTDREINELMQALEQNSHLVSDKDIRIEELNQSIKEYKEALEKASKAHNMNLDHVKRQEDLISQWSAAYQILEGSNRKITSESLELKEENEIYAVLSKVLLNPFKKFPNIRGVFVLQKPNEIWDMSLGIKHLYLSTQNYNIISQDHVSIDIYNKFTNEHILRYNTQDRSIKKIFASINEKFLIIEGSPKVYLLEILNCRSIEMRTSYEQELNNLICNTDSTCLITFSDSVAIVLDLISVKIIAAVTLQPF